MYFKLLEKKNDPSNPAMKKVKEHQKLSKIIRQESSFFTQMQMQKQGTIRSANPEHNQSSWESQSHLPENPSIKRSTKKLLSKDIIKMREKKKELHKLAL